MAKFLNAINKYQPLIESLFGKVDDSITMGTYKDAVEGLKKLEKTKSEYDRFNRLNKGIRGVNLAPTDIYQPTNDFDIQGTGAQLNETDAVKNYAKTLQDAFNSQATQTDEAGNPIVPEQPKVTPEGFKEYLKNNPADYQSLQQLGYVKPIYTKLEDQKIHDLMYQKAGFQPEDVQFYNEFKKRNFDPTEYNQKIQNMVLDNYPGLVSTGSVKDFYAKLYGNKAGMLDIKEPKSPDYKFMDLKDGKLLRYTSDGNYEVIGDGAEQKKKRLKDLSATEVDKLTFENLISGYAPAELFASLYDFSPEIRAKLIEKYPEWKPEEDVLKTGSRTRSRSYGRKDKDPLEEDLKIMSDIGLANNGAEFGKWKPADQEAYTRSMNSLKGLTQKSAEEIWGMVGDYEKKTYKQGDKGDNSRGKKSPYGNEITDEDRKSINDIYYSTKYGKFNGQSLSDWVKTLSQTEDRDTFYQWAGDVRRQAASYMNDLQVSKGMADEIMTDVENQIQRIKSGHQGW